MDGDTDGLEFFGHSPGNYEALELVVDFVTVLIARLSPRSLRCIRLVRVVPAAHNLLIGAFPAMHNNLLWSYITQARRPIIIIIDNRWLFRVESYQGILMRVRYHAVLEQIELLLLHIDTFFAHQLPEHIVRSLVYLDLVVNVHLIIVQRHCGDLVTGPVNRSINKLIVCADILAEEARRGHKRNRLLVDAIKLTLCALFLVRLWRRHILHVRRQLPVAHVAFRWRRDGLAPVRAIRSAHLYWYPVGVNWRRQLALVRLNAYAGDAVLAQRLRAYVVCSRCLYGEVQKRNALRLFHLVYRC